MTFCIGDKVRHWRGGEGEVLDIRLQKPEDHLPPYRRVTVLELLWWNGDIFADDILNFEIIEPNPVQPKYVELFL